jgi:transcriptional regulator with XRE-family HTH domain
MQLNAYLKLKGISEKQFAQAVGCSEAGVKKWVRRERIPRPDAMREIMRVTDGAVTAADFFAPSNGSVSQEGAAA